MGVSVAIFIGTISVFGILGFAMNQSIKKHESRKKVYKSKKGRSKYMPQAKNFGK